LYVPGGICFVFKQNTAPPFGLTPCQHVKSLLLRRRRTPGTRALLLHKGKYTWPCEC
jgi:hypothetical protein